MRPAGVVVFFGEIERDVGNFVTHDIPADAAQLWRTVVHG
jgi:hypothetical protein